MKGPLFALLLINVPQTMLVLFALRICYDGGATRVGIAVLGVAVVGLIFSFYLLGSDVSFWPRLGVAAGIVMPYFLFAIPAAVSMTAAGSSLKRVQWTVGLFAIPAAAFQLYLTLHTSCYAGYDCL
jgi:hypothetical protein